MTSFTIEARGPFDLARSIEFLEMWPAGQPAQGDATLAYATCGEDDWTPVGVALRPSDGGVRVETTREAGAVLRRQIARTLSLDVDATPLPHIGRRDPVIGRLQRQRPGLRPVLFWSPWEGAVWAVLTQRASMRQATAVKDDVARRLGTAVEVDGVTRHAFPSPAAFLAASEVPGVPAVKRARLRAIAEAAGDGRLTGDALRALDADEAMERLIALPGIGPFSAALVVIRGAGHPDVLTTSEPRLLERIRRTYGADADPAAVAEAWRPLRSWCAFLLRSATDEQLGDARD